MQSTKASGLKLNHVLTSWAHFHHHPSPQATHTGRRWWLLIAAAILFLLASAYYLGLIP